jgi:hypothetical protein
MRYEENAKLFFCESLLDYLRSSQILHLDMEMLRWAKLKHNNITKFKSLCAGRILS